MIGTGRLWLGLLSVAALGLLSGCDWLFGSSMPVSSQKLRPGADRQIGPTGALPAPGAGQQYEPGLAPVDETHQQPIGSIIQAKGGQKVQKEAADKEAAERDAKAREERQAREAADKEAADKEPKDKEPRSTKTGVSGLPGRPAAAEPGNSGSTDPAAPAAAPAANPAAPAIPAPPPEQPAAPPRT